MPAVLHQQEVLMVRPCLQLQRGQPANDCEGHHLMVSELIIQLETSCIDVCTDLDLDLKFKGGASFLKKCKLWALTNSADTILQSLLN